jgi:hypothetical protein
MAKKKLDLRKKKPAPPAAEAVPESTPVAQLPFIPGEKISLTSEERVVLESAGWKEGDPLPDLTGFMENIAQEQRDAAEDVATSGAPQLDAQKIAEFDDLPADKQDEIRMALDTMRAQQEQAIELAKVVPADAGPGVAEAIKVAGDFDGGIEVVDDPTAVPTPPPPVEKEISNTHSELSDPSPCEHCGWDPSLTDNTKPTKRDKYDFLASVLGGTRFYKELDLFGESVTVVFRTLTTEEADIALQQTSFDHRDGKVPDQGEFFRVYTNYRLAMSIEKLSTPGDAQIVPSIEDVEWDSPLMSEDPQTPLPTLETWINENILKSESMRRVIGMEHQRFQRLVEKMEARVDDADFWKGIEQRP